MSEFYRLFRRNFPLCIREEKTAKDLLSHPENRVVSRRDQAGNLIAASVVHQNTILMLCVDKPYRRQGIASDLLAQSEKMIRAAGYHTAVIGAGEGYLMPGVPAARPVVEESLLPDRIDPALEDHTGFFLRRGYRHAWDCNCFDMTCRWEDVPPPLPEIEGVSLRWAKMSDIPCVLDCVRDGWQPFERYYDRQEWYREGSQRVLIACAGDHVLGALIVSFGTQAPGLGSVGCTVVRESARGRGIAARLVAHGTRLLGESGMESACLGYTYTGLDRMYGKAGYRISCYYFMAQKEL